MIKLLRLALIVILFAGSVLMAPSRGIMAGASQIEVCSGGGAEILTLDASGRPVGPHQTCPDCVLCVATGPLPDAGHLDLNRSAAPLRYALPRAVTAAGVRGIDPTARDPPQVV